MSTDPQFAVIILDRPTQAQRDAVHARVKKAATSWWHSYENVWIVRGGPAVNEWIDRLLPVFKSGPASFLVLGLPRADDTRSWSYFGPDSKERGAWLHRQYTADR